MGLIRELDYSTVVRIAAGEVIDRPASMARELIDNAIDAGAVNIRVSVSDGGKGYLEVQDDGCGMAPEDLEICWKNHTTSKIGEFEDIFRLDTLGFRGEALASMAEVTDLTLRSRTAQSVSGLEIRIRGGKLLSSRETGMAVGTTVIAQNLFHEVPARKKFLSSVSAELKLIDREIVRKALGFPDRGFELVSEGKRKHLSPPQSTALEKIADFFPDCVDALIPVEHLTEEARVTGYVSRPAFLRSNRMYQHFFVNRRAVDWKYYYFAVQNAYGSLIPKGYFPAVFLYLDIPSESVDYNVHPMKREVRFRNDSKIGKLLEDAVRSAIHSDSGLSDGEEAALSFTPYEKRIGSALADYMTRHTGRPDDPDTRPARSLFHQEQSVGAETQSRSLLDYRFAGILFQTYIILEGDEDAIFLDQHALHERLNYEKFRKRYRENLLQPQELLSPLQIEVPRETVQDLLENLDRLSAMGFTVEHFGDNSFLVRSAPEFVDASDAGDMVLAFAQTLEEDRSADVTDDLSLDRAIKQMACKASVRSGDRLTKDEVTELIRQWEKIPERFSCPHGRPVAFRLGKTDLEKQFRRLGF